MRECPETQSSKSNFYTLYNEWSYPPEGKPSKKQWERVVNADKEINYESMPMDEKSASEDHSPDQESASEDSEAKVSVRKKLKMTILMICLIIK